MNALPYVLGIVCVFLYVCALVLVCRTAGTRCVFCNRRISGAQKHDFHGVPVCDVCWSCIKKDVCS